MNESMPILIITGSAPCLQEDMDALEHGDMMRHRVPMFPDGFDFMAAGLDAVDKYAWPIKYVVTYHPNEIVQIKGKRMKFGGNTDYKMISHIRETEAVPPAMPVVYEVDIVEPYKSPSGSSSLCGALAGIRLGYDRIVLCGCPLLEKKYVCFQKGWTPKRKELGDRVRSMSGWTKELLGAPTKEWLGRHSYS